MRELNIALGLIEQEGYYFLQLRDGDPKIGAAGLIGCFGGKIEKGEESAVAVCRELAEETNFVPQVEQAVFLGKVSVESDHQLEPVRVYAHVFSFRAETGFVVEAKEGQLVKLTYTQAMDQINTMTPGTAACFKELVKE